jgi:hypothetical protein
MNSTKRAVLAGVVGTLFLMPACQKNFEKGPGGGHHYGQQDKRVFEVYIYADPNDPTKCLADWPVGTLWKTKGHTVTWFSDDGGQYTVDFSKGSHSPDKSPFSSATFSVSSNGETPSGALQSSATGYYDFAIFSSNNPQKPCKDPSDPGYIVKP